MNNIQPYELNYANVLYMARDRKTYNATPALPNPPQEEVTWANELINAKDDAKKRFMDDVNKRRFAHVYAEMPRSPKK